MKDLNSPSEKDSDQENTLLRQSIKFFAIAITLFIFIFLSIKAIEVAKKQTTNAPSKHVVLKYSIVVHELGCEEDMVSCKSWFAKNEALQVRLNRLYAFKKKSTKIQEKVTHHYEANKKFYDKTPHGFQLNSMIIELQGINYSVDSSIEGVKKKYKE